jgi:superfamily II DNA/RNA helicase
MNSTQYSSAPTGRASSGHSSFGPRPPRPAQRPTQRHERFGNQGGRPINQRSGGAGRTKQYIHPSKFVQEARVCEKAEYLPTNSFEDFAVHGKILDNLKAKGYLQPYPIQDQTIPLVMQGKDVVGIANTGTGKTGAFAIPMIHDLVKHMDHRAIIMAPTRELAQQIMEECFSFGKGCGLKSALLIGGASMHLQKRDLRFNPRVVVGTPGRIKDHLQQRTLDLSFFNFVVLDEVDRMLDMGFINDITDILSRVSARRQSLFFSATMEPKVAKLIEKFSQDPVMISTKEGATVDSVSQNVVYYSGSNEKIEKLHDLLIGEGCGKTIIFDDTKRAVERLGKELHTRGFKVDQIHGDKSQAQRTRAIKRFKCDEVNILVATDVAARGIDVSDITHVINFSTPNSYDDYVHRIGRTGRAGKAGIALTFLSK